MIIQYYLKRQKLLYELKLEQVESDKLKELDSLKTRFYTNISHEFRTPLTLIQGPAQRVQSRTRNISDKKDLSLVLKNARRLKTLVNEILSLSKLESGKLQLEANEVEIIEFLRVNTQSFESLANHKKISLEFTSDENRLNAFIDREKLIQVLNNLLSNALKFTGEGGKVPAAPRYYDGDDDSRMAESSHSMHW